MPFPAFGIVRSPAEVDTLRVKEVVALDRITVRGDREAKSGQKSVRRTRGVVAHYIEASAGLVIVHRRSGDKIA
jgi:hypothetical protein